MVARSPGQEPAGTIQTVAEEERTKRRGREEEEVDFGSFELCTFMFLICSDLFDNFVYFLTVVLYS